MSRYIDADALREKWLCLQGHDFSPSSFVYSIDNAPTVDAVPAKRCAQCKWCDYPATNSTKYGCRLFDRCVKGDWFCADGERKDGETEQCNTYSLGKIEMPKGAMKQIIADGERKDGEG